MMDQHFAAIITAKYSRVLQALNLTANEFPIEFPKFDGTFNQLSFRGRTVDHVFRVVCFKLKDITRVSSPEKYLAFFLEFLHGGLVYFARLYQRIGASSRFTTDTVQYTKVELPTIELISILKLAFRGDVFSMGNFTHLVALKRNSWRSMKYRVVRGICNAGGKLSSPSSWNNTGNHYDQYDSFKLLPIESSIERHLP